MTQHQALQIFEDYIGTNCPQIAMRTATGKSHKTKVWIAQAHDIYLPQPEENGNNE